MRQNLFYYSLFVLAYVGIYFITGFFLFAYDEGNLKETLATHIALSFAQTLFIIVSFPLGLFKINWLIIMSSCILNPLIIAWVLQRLFYRQKHKIKKCAIAITATVVVFSSFIIAYFFLK